MSITSVLICVHAFLLAGGRTWYANRSWCLWYAQIYSHTTNQVDMPIRRAIPSTSDRMFGCNNVTIIAPGAIESWLCAWLTITRLSINRYVLGCAQCNWIQLHSSHPRSFRSEVCESGTCELLSLNFNVYSYKQTFKHLNEIGLKSNLHSYTAKSNLIIWRSISWVYSCLNFNSLAKAYFWTSDLTNVCGIVLRTKRLVLQYNITSSIASPVNKITWHKSKLNGPKFNCPANCYTVPNNSTCFAAAGWFGIVITANSCRFCGCLGCIGCFYDCNDRKFVSHLT